MLEAQVAPFYADTAGKRGRSAIGLSRMLRMYVVQQCFGFSDEGTEDAIYDSQAIRGFVGIDLSRDSAPGATTLLRFRRLLETHQLTRTLFETINQHLASRGLRLKEGTIVDATLIAAPPLDQEPRRQARSRHASGQERQPMALRHEGPHRRGCGDRIGA
jgi:IS5 family transposase